MENELIVGGIYSILSSSGKYKIVKILVLDELGVHLKIYQESFEERPREVNINSLTLGRLGEELSAGHIPVTDDTFVRAAPSYITKAEIADDELDGYYLWRDNNGGYWVADL